MLSLSKWQAQRENGELGQQAAPAPMQRDCEVAKPAPDRMRQLPEKCA